MSKLIASFNQSQTFHFVKLEVLVVLIEHGLDGVPIVQGRSLYISRSFYIWEEGAS
jgi:hypothetical protein